MATFSAVNMTQSPPPDSSRPMEEQTPTTPRQEQTFLQDSADAAPNQQSAPSTPTRHSFGAIPGQQALPEEPVTPLQTYAQAKEPESLKRDGSQRSPESRRSSQDVEMGDADDQNDGEDGSDNDSVTSDSQRPSKKKKGQRFFCTDFPPCHLSFTRSEHLARHIRKHTGERPFQCHCSRRFSRLDNLRQHAQTVHVNEEIPGDSLAATSTRFQRQIRTDRVRPPTNRSRASTISSSGGHSRGHSRNLSNSSVGSTASNVSMMEDTRRRPQPLAMAHDPSARARLSLDTYNNVAGSPQYAYHNQSPTGFSTPTSTVFSTGPGSPRFGSGMASPVSTLSRSSFYNGARRRLSVPSGPNAYQPPNANTYPPPMYFSPIPSATSTTFSQNSSVYASPTNSVFSHNRRDSEAELEYRRRTWHPGTYASYTQRPATSGLLYQQTPDDHRPAMSEQPAASQVTRLPGIESFDHAPPATSLPPSSPMMVDASPRPPSSGRPSDAGLPQNLTRLDIAAANAPVEGQWQASQAQRQQMPQPGSMVQQPPTIAPQQVHAYPEPPVTPRREKRQAWYNGPVAPAAGTQPIYTPHRPSPEDSGSSDGVPTPGTSLGTEYHPVIIHPNGAHEHYPPGTILPEEQKVYYTPHKPESGRIDSGIQTYVHNQPQPYHMQTGHDARFAVNYSQPSNNDMGRLEALVAVATSEGRAVERS